MKKKAIITGINGQDGAYLTQYLLSKDYEVHGIIRRNSVPEHQTFRLNSVYEEIKNNLHYGDLTDFSSLVRLISTIKPQEIYNLGAQSHVGISFDSPLFTTNTIVDGTINLLECIRTVDQNIRFYQASSSEMFGNQIDKDGFQRESTPMVPVSPYGAAKLCAFHNVQVYRKSYNIFASNGILFNHESPFRGVNFVTNKIVRGAVMIYKGHTNELRLGNLEASRDWGHAKDYVKAMHSILNHNKPDDFVCASGETHTVQELCNYVFDKLDISKQKIIIDEKFLRPNELFLLKGDPSKIKKELAWEPEYSFISMIDEMIEYWIQELK
jgi:GDPmannose 4,6-dehydratase